MRHNSVHCEVTVHDSVWHDIVGPPESRLLRLVEEQDLHAESCEETEGVRAFEAGEMCSVHHPASRSLCR